MPIYLRISLCMLIARKKNRNERGKKSTGKRIGKCVSDSRRQQSFHYVFIAENDGPADVDHLLSRGWRPEWNLFSLCRHRVPISGNASLWYVSTPCTRVPYLAQSPHASPNSRNDATCHRFSCNYDMHWDMDAPPPSNVQ